MLIERRHTLFGVNRTYGIRAVLPIAVILKKKKKQVIQWSGWLKALVDHGSFLSLPVHHCHTPCLTEFLYWESSILPTCLSQDRTSVIVKTKQKEQRLHLYFNFVCIVYIVHSHLNFTLSNCTKSAQIQSLSEKRCSWRYYVQFTNNPLSQVISAKPRPLERHWKIESKKYERRAVHSYFRCGLSKHTGALTARLFVSPSPISPNSPINAYAEVGNTQVAILCSTDRLCTCDAML